MRDFKGMKRQRGRNRKPGNGQGNSANPNRSWDSQGPENIKVRGNAQTVYERYQQLARDAASSGDRVLAENYLQHAEHYFRVLRALQPQRTFQEIAQREQIGQGFDIDFEDESGAQAAAFLAAQQAAERQAQQQNQNSQPHTEGGQSQADGESRDGENGARRESRRERWERRRDNRRNQYERDESEGGAAPVEALTEADVTQPAASEPSVAETPAVEKTRAPRRERTPAKRRDEDEENALPGFLTRPTPASASAAAADTSPAADETAEEKPAPRRRAPRRKTADAPAGEDA